MTIRTLIKKLQDLPEDQKDLLVHIYYDGNSYEITKLEGVQTLDENQQKYYELPEKIFIIS